MESSWPCPNKMLIFKAGESNFIHCQQLPYCLGVGNVLINRGAIDNSESSIPSHKIDVSPRISSTMELISLKESMPVVLKS